MCGASSALPLQSVLAASQHGFVCRASGCRERLCATSSNNLDAKARLLQPHPFAREIACSRSRTKIFPSPIFPVRAALVIASMAPSRRASWIGTSIFTLGNPGHNRPVIIQAAARHIVVPIDKVDEFHANLERNGDPLVTWQTYTLKKGETLNKVAPVAHSWASGFIRV